MKVTKEQGEFGLSVFLKEGEKYVALTFGGNGDLYWSIHSKRNIEDEENNYDYFIITKENYAVYSLFEQLFLDLEIINIFEENDIPLYIDSKEEKQEYLEKTEKEREKQKIRYREYNHSHYNELFNPHHKTITWYSDETNHEVANILKIKKDKDTFRIEFYTQPHIKGYDKDFHSSGYIPIRFRNSGSYYLPFNTIFMKMYHSMKEVDDVNEIGHQIHIEEYLYNKVLSKGI